MVAYQTVRWWRIKRLDLVVTSGVQGANEESTETYTTLCGSILLGEVYFDYPM